jgi:hypothetical protein
LERVPEREKAGLPILLAFDYTEDRMKGTQDTLYVPTVLDEDGRIQD